MYNDRNGIIIVIVPATRKFVTQMIMKFFLCRLNVEPPSSCKASMVLSIKQFGSRRKYSAYIKSESEWGILILLWDVYWLFGFMRSSKAECYERL